jgi:hypothetical protein
VSADTSKYPVVFCEGKYKTIEDFRKLLENSYKSYRNITGYQLSLDRPRLNFVSDHIFGFTTYDDEVSAEFAVTAIEVAMAITHGTTFDYIGKLDQPSQRYYQYLLMQRYYQYLLMVNLPFFKERIEWGTSIRGARWSPGYKWDQNIDSPVPRKYHTLESCGLWDGEKQILRLKFTKEEWTTFILGIFKFVKDEFMDTKLFSVEEILEDIKKSKGHHLTPKDIGCSTSVFLRKYSEYMPGSFDGLEQELEMIKAFLDDHSYHLPDPDVVPVDNPDRFWIYNYDASTGKSRFLSSCDLLEDVRNSIPDHEDVLYEIYVLDTEQRQIKKI